MCKKRGHLFPLSIALDFSYLIGQNRVTWLSWANHCGGKLNYPWTHQVHSWSRAMVNLLWGVELLVAEWISEQTGTLLGRGSVSLSVTYQKDKVKIKRTVYFYLITWGGLLTFPDIFLEEGIHKLSLREWMGLSQEKNGKLFQNVDMRKLET